MGGGNALECEHASDGQPNVSRHGGMVADLDGQKRARDERDPESCVLAPRGCSTGQEADDDWTERLTGGVSWCGALESIRESAGVVAAPGTLHWQIGDGD